MKCIRCSYEAFVLRTIEQGEPDVTREYRCPNGHSFSTREVLPTAIGSRELASSLRKVHTDRSKWARNQAILQDLGSATVAAVAAKWGLTEARIRQIHDTVPHVKERQ